jgi:hypothetical protein
MQLFNRMLVRACESWIVKLSEAARTGGEAYLHVTGFVQAQSDKNREHLTTVPKDILEDFIPVLARRFLDMITDYDRRIRRLELNFWHEETHNTVCKSMLRSLLTPTTKMYETLGISSSFAQRLVIETLDSVPNLTVFRLDTQTEIDHSALLATNIRHLPMLRVFQYDSHCTNEVIKQLGLHCRHLRKITFRYSIRVTDASVVHLMGLRNLLFVHSDAALFSPAGYGLLLSELPRISNIEFRTFGNALRHVTKDTLDTITHVDGYVHNFNLLTQKCPNVRKLNVYRLTEDMISVSALTSLRSLLITHGDYVRFNLNVVLQGIGHRLTELSLTYVERVNPADIVTLCSSLECLVLEHCAFLPLFTDITLDPESPHFKSLISLKLAKFPQDTTDFLYLRHYVNLRSIDCRGLGFFTDDFVRDCVRRGMFRNLECFHINEIWRGTMTMRTVELLMHHCKHLKSLGYLGTWINLNPVLIRDLKQGILLRNFDLKILLSD